jgi:hypothetical protein
MRPGLLASVLVVLTASPAHAQVAFPPDGAYIPLRCGAAPMTDRFQDQSGALDDRDLVGDPGAPAGLRASDATNLYLRMRLDQDPAPGGAVRPFAWGMQFDLDGDLTTYELMILLDGVAGATGAIRVYTNATTTLPNDPDDPADQPAAATSMFPMTGQSVTAPGSSFGGDADFFVDVAVPWSVLAPLGLDRDTPTHVWAGSSSSAISLNGDLACHDGASGPVRLDVTSSDPTTGDPALDPLGGGGAGQLEGGGGCTVGRGSAAPWLGLGLLAFVRRRRGRSARRGRGRR